MTHELYHSKRLDYLWESLGVTALCIHWFNPMVWISFKLFDRDIELSCDEGVLKYMGEDSKSAYAETLLYVAQNRVNVYPKPLLTFNESNVSSRIKNIVNYRRPKKGTLVAATLALMICGILLVSNPSWAKEKDFNILMIGSGVSQGFADSFILAKYSQETELMELTFVPRDLLVEEKETGEKVRLSQYHARYGAENTAQALGTLLEIETPNYIAYDGKIISELIDVLGGVEFDVPMDMQYSDPLETPPLNINIKAGLQRLSGEDFVKVMRYRKGYINGDLGRIETQQELVKAFIEQADTSKLLESAKVVVKDHAAEIRTNVDLIQLLNLYSASRKFEISSENVEINQVPIMESYEVPLGVELKEI